MGMTVMASGVSGEEDHPELQAKMKERAAHVQAVLDKARAERGDRFVLCVTFMLSLMQLKAMIAMLMPDEHRALGGMLLDSSARVGTDLMALSQEDFEAAGNLAAQLAETAMVFGSDDDEQPKH